MELQHFYGSIAKTVQPGLERGGTAVKTPRVVGCYYEYIAIREWVELGSNWYNHVEVGTIFTWLWHP
jgi:hypothetical protein